MRKIKQISQMIVMIGALLMSGDLVAYHAFSHASSSESRIEVETIEEGEVREFVARSRQVVRKGNQSMKSTYDRSSSFNPIFIKNTSQAALSRTPRFIQCCTFRN
ncbi:MAG: hypothetical protein R8G66_05240 [Cytophagales bacterium]|nr:hypothetical protein [Cytophagales bacterium]